jgi:Rad3-related DNA helicase
MRRTHLGGARRDGEIALPEPPAGFERAVERALEATSRISRLGLESASAHDTVLGELGLTLARWTRAANWYDGTRYATLLRAAGRELSLELRCLDPSAHIAEVLGEFRAHARFSGTLTPLGLFSRLHGVDGAQTLTLPSPFPPQHLGVFVVPDVSVRHRDRRSTLGRVTTLIETVVRARTGNYLVALPSFEYLDAVSDAFAARNPGSKILCQARDSTAEERADFLANFEPGAVPVIGFVVLGGVFSESIDLPGDRLIGMVVVGVGLPPRSLERDCESACLGPWGPVAAYRQPAVSKVVQAAGRIIRTENDRGVLCLVDDRYLAADYRDLLPAHWQLRRVRAAQLPDALDGFWRNG